VDLFLIVRVHACNLLTYIYYISRGCMIVLFFACVPRNICTEHDIVLFCRHHLAVYQYLHPTHQSLNDSPSQTSWPEVNITTHTTTYTAEYTPEKCLKPGNRLCTALDMLFPMVYFQSGPEINPFIMTYSALEHVFRGTFPGCNLVTKYHHCHCYRHVSKSNQTLLGRFVQILEN
jgi:hypothetical protein